ncbi:MAG: Uma2 family endonuclease [Eubacteriaceae bacterium]|nr:Uma2 family endonuclease [Eubacteriaceae bacterium]
MNEDKKTSEMINGVEYAIETIGENEEKVLSYLIKLLGAYKLRHRPLDVISDPNVPLHIEGMENTLVCPSLTVTLNGKTFPDWVIEVAGADNAEMTYLVKTGIYREAGVNEYWIIDVDQNLIMVYNFKKNGLVPDIFRTPQRIRVNTYKDLFISYSDLFKNKRG